MKKLIENIPLILLLVLIPYLFYNQPNIAQSIMVTAISALVGYRYYLDSLKKPDYIKIFTERLDEKDAEISNILEKMYLEIGEVRDGQNKLAIVQNNTEKAQNFKW